ncbi:MAG: hypothetical protein OXU31_05315 [Gammaproteobacteria bacterium]|nr:hypothetical protein [Gammaproteobacteria bacterium]
MQQLALVIPAPPHLAAAAHMGDGKHQAAPEQRQQRGAKVRRIVQTVGAVAGKQQRLRRAARKTGAVH